MKNTPNTPPMYRPDQRPFRRKNCQLFLISAKFRESYLIRYDYLFRPIKLCIDTEFGISCFSPSQDRSKPRRSQTLTKKLIHRANVTSRMKITQPSLGVRDHLCGTDFHFKGFLLEKLTPSFIFAEGLGSCQNCKGLPLPRRENRNQNHRATVQSSRG